MTEASASAPPAPAPEQAQHRPKRALSMADRQARDWTKVLGRYHEPKSARSLIELATTVLPLAALWLAMWLLVDQAYWLCLMLAVPAAGLLVRLFTIQHDCGHGSFFRRRRANDWVGRVLGVFTLTPYGHWRHAHAVHHASAGNLDKRGIGDIDTLTVREFEALTFWGRLRYRLARNPLVVLVIAPLYIFVVHYRLPTLPMWSSREAWISAMTTNLAIAGMIGLGMTLVGVVDFLMVQLPITWLAASVGVLLFYVQHQFEHTYWEEAESWSFHSGALHGSSHLDLPPILRWFTANIGVHHVHHLASRIPSYRLGEVLQAHPDLREVNRLTLLDCFKCFRLNLWDENMRRLVSFREARRLARHGSSFAAATS